MKEDTQVSKDRKIILEARNIHKSYSMGREQMRVLQGVNLQVHRGEFLAVMGASGSGKSTLLHICGLLDRSDKGQVWFEGEQVFQLRKARQDKIRNLDIGFVFQFYHLLPELNVTENVLLPMMVESSVFGWLGRRRQARERVAELLEAVGLTGQRKQWPATLSGGERQRAAIARALVQKPKLLLADEPTGNLDTAAGKVILELLARLNRTGQTIVMVTHDPNVAQLADRKVVLRDGKIFGG
ncbi:ABC transporter ATP-binding protein [Planctomycetota bacterium]